MYVNLDRKIRLERPVAAPGATFGAGADAVTWALVATVWASWLEVAPSRSEAVKAGLQLARQQVRVRIRYLAGLDSSMRVVYGGAAHNIVGGPAEIGRKEYLEMVVERYSS